MKKRSTRSKIRHGSRELCRSTAIFDRAETAPAEFCQVKEHKENVGTSKKRRSTAIFDRAGTVPAEGCQAKEHKENAGTFKKRRSTTIFDRGGCVRAKVNCTLIYLITKF